MLTIVKAPNPILNRVCSVAVPPSGYVLFCADLVRTMHQTEGAVGLAAPQVNVDVRIFAFLNKVAVNPKIIALRGARNVQIEGCLSLPGQRGYVFRHDIVDIEYYSPDGAYHVETLRGWPARVFQREFDHIEGILITSKFVE